MRFETQASHLTPHTYYNERVLTALRYYWETSKGYRWRPWASPYIQWRLETYFGKRAEHATTPAAFFSLLWRERAEMRRFLTWVAERRAEQRAARTS